MKKALFFFAIVLSSLLFTAAVSAQTVSGSVITSVTVGDNILTVTADITGYYAENGTQIFLFRTDFYGAIQGLPLASAAAERSVSFSVPFDADDRAAFGYGYVLAVTDGDGYGAITGARFAENISDFSLNASPYPVSYTKKGLEIADITDAQRLGVGHTTINVYLDLLLADDGIPFSWNGKTVFVDTDTLARLDAKIKSLTLAGINVFMNVLPSRENTGSIPEDSAAELSAVLSFIAERYTGESMKYGFCGSFIIGRETNEGYTRTEQISDYISSYIGWLRACYVSVVSAYSGARVYVPVSNRWNPAPELTSDGGMGARAFLDGIAVFAPDIPFGIAVAAYPSDPETGDFTADALATESADSPLVTVSNLSVVSERFPGRRIVVSEFGISGSGENQAEQFTAAYEIAEKLESVEALIWHRHIDSPAERYGFGLYTSDPAGNAKEAKPLLASFAETGTAERFSPAVSVRPGITEDLYVIDFETSTCSFYPSDSALYLISDGGYMRVASSYAGSVGCFGAGKIIPSALLEGADTMTVSLRVTGQGSLSASVLLSGGGNVLLASAPAENGEWITLTFDISEFTRKTENCDVSLKLWAQNDEGCGNMFLDVRGISLDYRPSVLPYVTIGIVCAAAITACTALTAVMLKKRRKD